MADIKIEIVYQASMPTIRQLTYLVALSEQKHFRRAAESCHVTQPTLSAQIKDLEARLGIALLERRRGRVLLTPGGEAVLERAKRILRDVDEIRAIAAADQGVLETTIRIGVVQSLGSYLLPLIVPDLHAEFPKLGLYVREGLPETLLRKLDEGAFDLLFFPMPIRQEDLDSMNLFREPIEVVLPCDHPLAAEEAIEPKMLKAETVLAMERGHRLSEQVRDLCETFGAELSHDYEGTSLDTLRQMVALGMGISLLPALYVRSEVRPQDLVIARPFRGNPPSRIIGLVWRRGTAREAEYRSLGTTICRILRDQAPEVSIIS